jgi:hypothetical protein
MVLKSLEVDVKSSTATSTYYKGDGLVLVGSPDGVDPWRKLRPSPMSAAREAMASRQPQALVPGITGAGLSMALGATMHYMGRDEDTGDEKFTMIFSSLISDDDSLRNIRRERVDFVGRVDSLSDDESDSDSDYDRNATTPEDHYAHIHKKFATNIVETSLHLDLDADPKLRALQKRMRKAHPPLVALASYDVNKVIRIEETVMDAWKEGGYGAASAVLDANLDAWRASRLECLYGTCKWAIGCVHPAMTDTALLAVDSTWSSTGTDPRDAELVVAYDLGAALKLQQQQQKKKKKNKKTVMLTVQPRALRRSAPSIHDDGSEVVATMPAHVFAYADGRVYIHLPFMHGPVLMIK